MINTSQLRMGNFIQDKNGKPIVVFSIQENSVNESVSGPLKEGRYILNAGLTEGDAFPIPLTPEWLGKFGFTGLEYGVWDGPKIELEDSIEWFTIEEYRGGFILKGSEWVMGKPFQYVHQLQNLYHGLTGEELNIKVTV
jgi:hypothetical protein